MITPTELLRSPGARRTGALAVVLLVALGMLGFRAADRTEIVAYFERTDGIYAGDEVRILGVPVGRIDEITPAGTRIRVEFHLDDDVAVPAAAHAVVVAPSLVSSRYIQLAPRYAGGPQLRDGATIPMQRTAVPVEWDDIKAQLNDLAVALGPRGANRKGALSQLVNSAAGALDGQGSSVNRTIRNLASAMEVLDDGADDAFSTVRNLQVFVSALAASDVQVSTFIERLDAVSQMVADDRRLVRTALRGLASTVQVVERFVKKHGAGTTRAVRQLGAVVKIVADQQTSLAQLLHAAPNALENLTESYHQRQNAVGIDLHGANIHSPGQLICGAIGGAAGTGEQKTAETCSTLIGDLLDQVANSPQSQQLLQALLLLLGGAR